MPGIIGHRVPEKVEQAHIMQLLRSIGAKVYVLGHPSPADGRTFRGTGQTPGLSDLYCILPVPRFRSGVATALWVEVKAEGGRLRPEQRAFRDACVSAAVAHIVGGLDDVIRWLINGGWLRTDSVAHYRI